MRKLALVLVSIWLSGCAIIAPILGNPVPQKTAREMGAQGWNGSRGSAILQQYYPDNITAKQWNTYKNDEDLVVLVVPEKGR